MAIKQFNYVYCILYAFNQLNMALHEPDNPYTFNELDLMFIKSQQIVRYIYYPI
jgi:hypothetical protein